MTRDQAKRALLEWVSSGGFAATHAATPRASDEAIVEDLLRWLEARELRIIRDRGVLLTGTMEARNG
jgi:hypothetical protein